MMVLVKQDLQIYNEQELKKIAPVNPAAEQFLYDRCRSDRAKGHNTLSKTIEVVTFHSFFFVTFFLLNIFSQ